jgi:hypothetical protein
MAKRLITVNDILAGHVSLDVACLDRIYLNGYLPTVQVPGQVVQFLQHRGFPIPSPAVVETMGTGFAKSKVQVHRRTASAWECDRVFRRGEEHQGERTGQTARRCRDDGWRYRPEG